METDRNSERKFDRREKIEAAAYIVLEKHGYKATSMLKIAHEAKASNETLYRWYGNKLGLFASLIEGNAGIIKQTINEHSLGKNSAVKQLAQIAPALLSVLLGNRAIELNRAAANDPSYQLGRLLAQFGRESIAPLIQAIIQKGLDAGELDAPSAETATDWFLSLLIGDLQIRRAIGGMPIPSATWVETRAKNACGAFVRLTEAT